MKILEIKPNTCAMVKTDGKVESNYIRLGPKSWMVFTGGVFKFMRETDELEKAYQEKL